MTHCEEIFKILSAIEGKARNVDERRHNSLHVYA